MNIEINDQRFLQELYDEISDVLGVCNSASCTLGIFNKKDGTCVRIGLVVEEILDCVEEDTFLNDLDIIQVTT